MKNGLFLSVLLLIAPAALLAQAAAFTYQGRLVDGGQPANGYYDLQFTLADSASSGNYVGVAVTNAAVTDSNGLFSVTLDFGASVFDGSARWLEIGVRTNGSVGPYTVLSPRQAINRTPYATFANTAASAALATSITPGALAGTGGLTNGSTAANLTLMNPTFATAFDAINATNFNATVLSTAMAQSMTANNISLLNLNYSQFGLCKATNLPTFYTNYISTFRATSDNGWPVDGQVTTIRNAEGICYQINSSFTSDAQTTRCGFQNTWFAWSTNGITSSIGANSSLTVSNITSDFVRAAPVQPNTISGLALWLDASASTNAFGTQVTYLADKSGNGRNAVTTGAGPILTNDSSGKPALLFSDSGTQLYISNSISARPFSMFVVATVVVWEETTRFILENPHFAYYVKAVHVPEVDQIGVNDGNYNTLSGHAVFVRGAPYLAEVFFDAGYQSFVQPSFYTNGALTDILEISNRDSTNVTHGFDQPVQALGGRLETNAGAFNGMINEVLVFNRLLTTSERQQIEAYETQKWLQSGNANYPHGWLDVWGGITNSSGMPVVINGATFSSGGVISGDGSGLTNLTLSPDSVRFANNPTLTGTTVVSDGLLQVTAFAPNTIPNLALWLDASTVSNTYGTQVKYLCDKSGNGRNAVTTGNGPRYTNSSGKPSLLFDASGTPLYISNSISSRPFSMFAVMAVNPVLDTTSRMVLANPNFAYYVTAVFSPEIDTLNIYDGNYNTKSTASAFVRGVPFLSEVFFNPGYVSFIQPQFYTNGAFTDFTEISNRDSTNVTHGFDQPVQALGGQVETGDYAFNGILNEVVIFSRILSTAERQQVEAYLMQKWLQPGPTTPAYPHGWVDVQGGVTNSTGLPLVLNSMPVSAAGTIPGSAVAGALTQTNGFVGAGVTNGLISAADAQARIQAATNGYVGREITNNIPLMVNDQLGQSNYLTTSALPVAMDSQTTGNNTRLENLIIAQPAYWNATNPPSAYTNYISSYRASDLYGWPVDGQVTTIRYAEGIVYQINSGYQSGAQATRCGFQSTWYPWIRANAVAASGLKTTNTPSAGQVLKYDGTNMYWSN